MRAARIRVAAAVAVLAVAGCGGSAATASAPAVPRTSSPAPSSAAAPGAPGAAFCASLTASDAPQVTYSSEVERQVGLASGSGSVTSETIQAARTIVALWITISCPQYAYLEKGG